MFYAAFPDVTCTVEELIAEGDAVVAFNRDPEAPLMTLNQRQPRPRVFPIIGDLFETVPALTEALQHELSGQPEPVAPGV